MNHRPAEELYDLHNDPEQSAMLKQLRDEVQATLERTSETRLEDAFDELPWVDAPKP
ncbi:MAG: hypothetical protein AAGH89_17370 [Verrucomicrobiota bacterium]